MLPSNQIKKLREKNKYLPIFVFLPPSVQCEKANSEAKTYLRIIWFSLLLHATLD